MADQINEVSKPQTEDRFPKRILKIITYFVLFVIISAITYFSFVLFSPDFFDKLTIGGRVPPEAYFRPPSNEEYERIASGRIARVFNDSIGESTYEFELVNKEGERLSYLVSEVNNLALSVGFEVEVQGILNETTEDGTEVISVLEIKLK